MPDPMDEPEVRRASAPAGAPAQPEKMDALNPATDNAGRQSEAALRESEARYRRLVEGAPAIVYTFSNTRGSVYYSPYVEQVLGYSVAHLYAHPLLWKESIHPDDRARLADVIREFEQGKPFDIEYRVRDAQGNWHWLRDRSIGRQVRDDEVLIEGLAIDITDRKQTEEVLRASKQRAQAMLHAIPDLMFRLDRQGVFLDYQADIQDLYAQSDPNIIGKRNRDISPPDFADLIDRQIQLTLETGALQTFEYQLPIPGRGLRDYEARMVPCGAEEVTAIVRDVTERKRAEAKYRDIFENAIEGIFQSTPDGRFLSVNAAMARIFGYDTPAEMIVAIGPDIASRIYTRPSHRAEFVRILAQTGVVKEFEAENNRKDGCVIWTRTSARAIRDADGAILYYEGFLEDITENKQAESQREAALKARQQSEERFRTIFEQAPLGMALVDSLTGQILEVNARYVEIFGGTRERLTHIDWMSITHPADLQPDLSQMARLNAGDIAGFSLEKRCFHADGTVFWINLTVAAVNRGDPRQARHLSMVEDITARKQTEEALRANQHFIESVVNTTPDIVYINDLETHRNVYSNREVVKVLGYSFEQMQQLGDQLFEFLLHPDDAVRMVEHARLLASVQDEVVEIEYRMRNANGQWRWLHSRERAFLRNADGTVRQIIGTASDVTERKQAEEALKAEYNFRIAIENSMQAGVAVIGVDNRQSAVNPYFSKMVGWPAEELIGQPAPFVYWPPSELENINRAFQLALQGQVPDTGFELKFRRKTGELFDVLVSLSVLENSDNEIIGWLAVVNDITERKRAEQAILESEKRYRDLFENAPLAIFQSTPAGRVVTVNPVFARMFGYASPEEVRAMVNNIATDLFADPQRRSEIMRQQAENPALKTFENLYRRKDGSTFLGRLNVSAITDASGRMLFFEGFIEDITEYRRAEDNLRQREQEYKTLVENTPDVIIRFDRQYRHLYVNPAVEKEFGAAPAALLGKTHRELGQPPDLADWSEGIIRQVFETGQEVAFELTDHDKSYLSRGVPEFAEDGSIRSALFIHHNITARKQTESQREAALEALRISEERYRTLFELESDAIFLVDEAGGEILEANTAATRLYGYSRAEFLALRNTDLSAQPNETRRAMSERRTLIPIRYHRKQDGTIFPVEIVANPMLWRGRPCHIAAIRDIGERQRSEAAERAQRALAEALRDTAAALNSTLDFNDVLDRILDNVGRVVLHDSADIILLDAAREIGQVVRHHGAHELAHPVETQALQLPIAHARHLREMQAMSAPVIIADTSAYDGWIDISPAERIRASLGVPILVKGETIGFLILNRDMPDAFAAPDADHLRAFVDQAAVAVENARLHERIQQHAAELEQRVAERTAELAAERNRMRLILDTAGDGIYFMDRQQHIQYLNPAMEKICDYASASVLGRRPQDLWRSGLTAPAVIAELDRRVAQGRGWHGEVINRRPDGKCYDAALTLTPLRNAEGETTGFVVVHSDISRLKELERLKDQFVTRIGHELRTPLMSLFLYLDLLEHGKPEKRAQYVQTLRQEADRLRRLVEGFLRLAELEARTAPLALAPVDLNVMAADLAIDRHKAIAQRELTLDVRIDPLQRILSTDAALLYEALSRVLDNAINYTPRHGRVTVGIGQRTEDDRRWYTLAVRDTGPGFSPVDMTHLFERFYRGSAAQDYKTPGVGLSLAICKAIMDRLDGRITVESQPGQGATFTLWLQPDPQGS